MGKIEVTNLWQCELILMDYLFFATTKRSAVTEMSSFIHNYSLTYAIGLASSQWHTSIQKATYKEDLSKLQSIYITPAKLVTGTHTVISSRLDQDTYLILCRKENENQKNERKKCFKPGSIFKFHILTNTQLNKFPSYIRLGKLMAKAKLIMSHPEQIEILEGDFTTTSILNWSDMAIKPNICDVILYSLHGRLIKNAKFIKKYYLKAGFANGEEVKLPLDMGYFRKKLCSSWWDEAA